MCFLVVHDSLRQLLQVFSGLCCFYHAGERILECKEPRDCFHFQGKVSAWFSHSCLNAQSWHCVLMVSVFQGRQHGTGFALFNSPCQNARCCWLEEGHTIGKAWSSDFTSEFRVIMCAESPGFLCMCLTMLNTLLSVTMINEEWLNDHVMAPFRSFAQAFLLCCIH